jgi:hypothetical protein
MYIIPKKIARAQFDKGHTSQLSRNELSAVNETLQRILAQKGIDVPFPSADLLFND